MRLNPTLYKVVQEARADPKNFTDPFQKIMEQQHKWIDKGSDGQFINNLVYRSDLDHPLSMHNQAAQLDKKMKVSFPQTRDQPLPAGQKPAKFELNGFYDKEAVSLNGGFKPSKNEFLQPVDNRIYNPTENFNQDHQNKLYRANTELLAEIERT